MKRQDKCARRIQREKAEKRLQRIRLLSYELDAQRGYALARTQTQETKASFVLVAVSLVTGTSFLNIGAGPYWLLGLIPSVTGLVTAILAAAVLWPRPIRVISAKSLVEIWVDQDADPSALEDYILESKKLEITERDEKQRKASRLLKAAFWMLLISISLVIIIAVVNGLLPNGAQVNG